MIDLTARCLEIIRALLAPGRHAKPSLLVRLRRRAHALLAPRPKPEPIKLLLIGQRRAPWDREAPASQPAPNALPLCSGIRQPIPAHLLARTILPVPELVRGHVRAHVHSEVDRQRERRACAFAAQLELPDPMHWLDDVFTGMDSLTGVVA